MQRHFKVKRSIYVLSTLSIFLLLSAGCGDKAAAGAEAAGTDPTGSAAAVTDHSAEAQKESEDAAPDTKPALKPGMIFNTQKNELGQLVGGQPGDQTGKETRIEAYPSYYRADSYPWDYILHCTDDELRLEAVRLACAGAANDMLGYDSGDLKNTFWEEVQAADYDPALVANPCSANCATSVLTFYRCAAIRLGMAYARKEIIDVFNKVKYPYNVNLLAQQQAMEALKDPFEVDKWVKMLLQERTRMIQNFKLLPITEKIYPTDANFILVKVNNAQKIYDYLVEKGIIVRNRTRIQLCENCLRITVGNKSENNEVLAALRQY